MITSHSLSSARSYFIVLLLLLTFHGCTCEKKADVDASRQSARVSPRWFKESAVARIELQRPADGKLFKKVQQKIPELKSAGFTAVWFSPVSPTSSLYQQGAPTDPVPTQDFLNVADEFGSLDDFKALVAALHESGLKVIVDLALKYTAWDSKLVEEHPDWFRKNEEGAIVAPNIEWSNVADLNFEHHELRKYMYGVLRFWLQDVAVDGIAFQKADLIPLDFWTRARSEVESGNDFVFLAQSNLPAHHLEVFDATYANDGGIPGLERNEIPSSLSNMLDDEASAFPAGALRMRFTAPIFDYPQVDSVVAKPNPLGKIHAALAHTIPGIPVTVLDGRWIYSQLLSAQIQFVSALHRLRSSYPGIGEQGLTERKLAEQPTFIAFERKLPGVRLLVLLNYANAPQNILLQLPPNFQGGFGDYVSDSMLTPSGGALQFDVAPFDVKILTRKTEETQQ